MGHVRDNDMHERPTSEGRAGQRRVGLWATKGNRRHRWDRREQAPRRLLATEGGQRILQLVFEEHCGRQLGTDWMQRVHMPG